jgi:cell division protein FtsL
MSLLTVGDPRRTHGAAALRPEPAPRVRPRPDLRLVAVPRRRLRVGLLSTILIVTLFVGLFALAAMHSLVVQAQFELDRIDEQVATRRDQIDARRVEVAELESPAAIVRAADELGMVSPEDVVYLRPNER